MMQRTNAFPELDRDLRFLPLGVEEARFLTNEQIRRYNDKGHLFPIDIFSQPESTEIGSYFDDLLPKAMDAEWDGYELTNWHKHCRGVWDIVTDSRITECAAPAPSSPQRGCCCESSAIVTHSDQEPS